MEQTTLYQQPHNLFLSIKNTNVRTVNERKYASILASCSNPSDRAVHNHTTRFQLICTLVSRLSVRARAPRVLTGPSHVALRLGQRRSVHLALVVKELPETTAPVQMHFGQTRGRSGSSGCPCLVPAARHCRFSNRDLQRTA